MELWKVWLHRDETILIVTLLPVLVHAIKEGELPEYTKEDLMVSLASSSALILFLFSFSNPLSPKVFFLPLLDMFFNINRRMGLLSSFVYPLLFRNLALFPFFFLYSLIRLNFHFLKTPIFSFSFITLHFLSLVLTPTLALQTFFLSFPFFYFFKVRKMKVGDVISEMKIKVGLGELPFALFYLSYLYFLTILSSLLMLKLGLFDLRPSEEVKLEFAFTALIAPVSEEIFFRGFVFRLYGLFPSALLFALMHFGYASITQIFLAFIAGIILAKAYENTENLFVPILIHLLVNSLSLLGVWATSTATR